MGFPVTTALALVVRPPVRRAVRLVRGDDLDADEGVLHLWTPALTPGYLNLPERTAAAITGDGYYVTGDVMRRDVDGFHYFVGRADDMFVCNGRSAAPPPGREASRSGGARE